MPRILLIDDSATVRKSVMMTLRDEGLEDIAEARNGVEGLGRLHAETFDLVLCDVVMPEMGGFEVLKRVRSEEKFEDLAIIMLSGRDDVGSKIEGLNLGASDYITKPFDRGELVARIRVHLRIRDLQNRLKEANERLLYLSNTDPLTKVSNRRNFMESFGREFERSKRYLHPLSFAILDVDKFKSVNDDLGHQAGDLVLKSLAGLIRSSVRATDIVARYGGEEFVVLMPETNLNDAKAAAGKLREAIEGHDFELADGRRTTVSVGISEVREDDKSISSVIKRADDALYEAKESGRNRCVCG